MLQSNAQCGGNDACHLCGLSASNKTQTHSAGESEEAR